MKTKLIIITIMCCAVGTASPTFGSLESLTEESARGESLWILVPMPDSFENKIMEILQKDPKWEKLLRHYKALSFEEVRAFIEKRGFLVVQSEVKREITPLKNEEARREWIETWLLSFQLDEEEKELLTDEVLRIMSGKVFFLSEQLLMNLCHL